MLRYAGRRLGQTLPVALLVTALIFLLIKLLPGDPAAAILGERASDEAIRALHRQWGLDRPLWQQYGVYMGNLLTGDLGDSLRYRTPVTDLLPRRAAVTLFLVVYSLLLSVALAVPLAVVAATHRERWPDHLVRGLITLPLASPAFWIGILLLIVFALKLGWFPATGYGEGFLGHLRHLFLPALTLSHAFAAVLTRNLRSALIDVQTTTYVDFARAKGLDRRRVLVHHVLRAALLPIVTLVGVRLSYAIGGSVVIETVFALPGLGSWMVESILARDYMVVQTLTLAFAFGAMAINLATDLVYPLFDPRVRMG
ncbi:MAG: ABC transporter permease [Candidatus Rokubacteria bacterium]|nr:ABC transporter permease [Candidatus Rokubacteria bacterium]